MREYKCKCGNAQWFGSDIQECDGCSICKTNALKQPVKEHEFVIRYHNLTGEPYEICRVCLYKKGDR